MASPVAIRQERPEDIAGIRAVNVLAFAQPAETDLVDALRDAEAVTLSLVTERDGRIVGHILFSPVTIHSPQEAFPAVGLGPMAVEPGLQQGGIGSALVRAGLSELRAGGHEVVVVLGHAEYCPRFGFVRASGHGIRWEQDVPDEAFMVLELTPGALRGRGGVVRYARGHSRRARRLGPLPSLGMPARPCRIRRGVSRETFREATSATYAARPSGVPAQSAQTTYRMVDGKWSNRALTFASLLPD